MYNYQLLLIPQKSIVRHRAAEHGSNDTTQYVKSGNMHLIRDSGRLDAGSMEKD